MRKVALIVGLLCAPVVAKAQNTWLYVFTSRFDAQGNPATIEFTLPSSAPVVGSIDAANATHCAISVAGRTNETCNYVDFFVNSPSLVFVGISSQYPVPGDIRFDLQLFAFDQPALLSTAGSYQSQDLGRGRATLDVTRTTTVPEPSAYVMMAAGLGAIAVIARRRRTTTEA